EVMNNIDLVFHTAALKHIPFCEQAPLEAVQSNIVGVKNVIAAATARKVLRVLFTSSDKGVNPASVMGATKLVGERLISSSHDRDDHQTVFFSTRFGNVLGSSGSVVPVFHQQIAAGGPVTLTDPRMTRFAMTVSQAAELLLSSADQATGGEVFITKMPVIRIKDLAEVMIDALAPVYGHKARTVELEITGIRPGEKLSEELMSTEEVARACELEKYFVVLPDSQPDDSHLAGAAVSKAYSVQAQAPLEKSQLLQFLRDGGLLEPMP
ncbi:MAG: polysaccharide biosynthesis protein, partial [Gammaproteobacteria bacterium]|nr:polysaccharide biosynthesis protein [Gammaproteobacteria bacterium]